MLDRTTYSTLVYTDDYAAYRGIPRLHTKLRHSVGQYVDAQAHTNGMESFWSMMKRGFHGVYHQMSPKHLNRYIAQFAGRHNVRPLDTKDQMEAIVRGAERSSVYPHTISER